MGRKIDIRWPELDITVVAELADETNPELCEEFWQHLPFKVLQAHPVVSGESVYAWTPIVSTAPVRHREQIMNCPVGRLRYSQATGNKFSVQYGRGLEPLAQPVLGMVLPEYHAQLPIVGKAIWENVFWRKELLFVVVSQHGAKGQGAARSGGRGLPDVARMFIEEAERIQTVEPEDLRKVRLGQIGDTGTYGQYFTAWDFVNGMLRDYIMYTIFPLLRLADKLGPKEISASLDEFDPPYSEYLSYSGLVTLERFAKALRAAVREAKSAEEVKVLLRAFLRYGNRLCAWSYHYFPWYVGMFYGRQVNGQELPGRWNPAAAAAPAAAAE
ncbi:MAG: DUF3830 family protein [Proteobacteria bacterium]|nr:DUF3830 family protein [Pseudomonadota bacterium]MBI3497614.1 DUF3830 family protein [Pseudomonadota bacterium]